MSPIRRKFPFVVIAGLAVAAAALAPSAAAQVRSVDSVVVVTVIDTVSDSLQAMKGDTTMLQAVGRALRLNSAPQGGDPGQSGPGRVRITSQDGSVEGVMMFQLGTDGQLNRIKVDTAAADSTKGTAKTSTGTTSIRVMRATTRDTSAGSTKKD